ncbi:MAG: hypothetical protein JXR95_16615 [Deltaproteobacteria bacterium]|nr:hypothetical protein [Deltaproteobacteria bacterium]
MIWSKSEPQLVGKYIIAVLRVSPDVNTNNRILNKIGLKKIEPTKWYSQQLFLKFFALLLKEKGEDYLYSLGKELISETKLPGNVTDFQSAVSSLDLGYTIAHRNQSGAMFGQKNYNEYQLEVVAANPYPCPFDWGILQQLITNYSPGAILSHDFSKGCRLDGDHACHYTITF